MPPWTGSGRSARGEPSGRPGTSAEIAAIDPTSGGRAAAGVVAIDPAGGGWVGAAVAGATESGVGGGVSPACVVGPGSVTGSGARHSVDYLARPGQGDPFGISELGEP